MSSDVNPVARRADATRNRDLVVAAARDALDDDPDVSLAEVARRAGVGMATLYRNFPSRRHLLEALYVGEVDALCAAAATARGETPGERLDRWLERFAGFLRAKHPISDALLRQSPDNAGVLNSGRDRVLVAAAPLLEAARASGEIRPELTLDQVLDLVLAVSGIPGRPGYVRPLLRVVLAGLRPDAVGPERRR